MENITAFWQGQDKRRLFILALATSIAFGSVLFLTRLATAPSMELLFARLEPAVAAEVVASLDSRGVPYEVRGDAVYVDGTQRDALRMQLAGEGLPRMDGAGYELLDNLSGFGTTSQMFDAAFWRAREGELTRTILASPGVRQARVHLATADSSPFARDRSATASVTVQMTSGAVGVSLARAIQSLVAGAVRNLSPEDVTVIDAASGSVVGGGAVDTAAEARDSRMAEMRSSVENLLAARVGPGRYVVELAVETTKDRETVTERMLDPDSRVVISTDTEERTSSDRGGAGQGVTVASNLPDGDAGGEAGGSESNNAETRERVNYDVSMVQRQIEREPGAISRVTVAVMVDGVRETSPDGTAAWSPRSDEELQVLRDLVQSAVGFREDRGDVVTVHTMQFEAPVAPETAPGLSLPWLSGGQMTQMVTAALLALVGLGAMAFVVRPMLNKVMMSAALPTPNESEAASGNLPEAAPRELALDQSGPTDDLPALAPMDELPDLPDLSDLSALPNVMGNGLDESVEPEDPVERLRQLISDRREETIEVLRGWMDEKPGEAR